MESPTSIAMTIAWLIGGLALFLYGIELMGTALRKTAGSALRGGLDWLTRTRFHGLLTGTGITALLQSSSATTVMIVSLISAGLLTFPQSMGLILGANIGTTITPQITALDLDRLALPLLGAGFLFHLVVKRRVLRQVGMVCMGFGMLFFGLFLMKAAVQGYHDNIRLWFAAHAAGNFGAQALVFLVAAVATGIIQSSAATIVMVQALAVQGAIGDLSTAIPMIMGAHVGTCVTALLASLNATRPARRAAVAHFVLNVVGIVISLVLFRFYAWFIPHTTDDMGFQVANCHLAMKLVHVICFLPFVRPFTRLVTRMVSGTDKLDASPEFLDYGSMDKAATALDDAASEVRRMCAICSGMVHDAVGALLARDDMIQERVLKQEAIIDDLYNVVTDYTLKVSQQGLPPKLAAKPTRLLHMMNDVERIGDHAENIVELNALYANPAARLSDRAREDVAALLVLVDRLGDRTLRMMETPSQTIVEEIEDIRNAVKKRCTEVLARHEERLSTGNCTIMAGIVFDELVTNLRSTANHLRNIALVMSPANGPH